jgi:hypothetical protein
MGFRSSRRNCLLGAVLLLPVPVFSAQGQAREQSHVTGYVPYLLQVSLDLVRLDEPGTNPDSTTAASLGAVGIGALVGAGSGLLYYVSLGAPSLVGSTIGSGTAAGKWLAGHRHAPSDGAGNR